VEGGNMSYGLEQIRANKNAIWKWKINLNCRFCQTEEEIKSFGIFEGYKECGPIFADLGDGKLTVVLICEDCFNKWKERK